MRFIFIGFLLAWTLPICGQDITQFIGADREQDDTVKRFLPPSAKPAVRWTAEIGEGRSSVLVHGDAVIATGLKPWSDTESSLAESQRKHVEAIQCLDRATGSEVWRHEYDAGWIKEQQTFGGRARAPQSTPVIVGDHVISIGFTGKMVCLGLFSGKPKWTIDLVSRFGMTPVSFGFSASPIKVGPSIVALVGGQKAGLICVRPEDGSIIWNYPCNEASYATPAVMRSGTSEHIVFVTRNRVASVDSKTGRLAWQFPLSKQGLTNVPTPLVIDDRRLIVSGQGVGGTIRLDITRFGEGWAANEAWKSESQFFYCNWIRRRHWMLACDGELLQALDLATGERRGRWRGYPNANLLDASSEVVSLGGDGVLTFLRAQDDRMLVLSRWKLTDQRSWTTPSFHRGDLFCRYANKLVCVALDHDDSDLQPLQEAGTKRRELMLQSDLETKANVSSAVDPVTAITDVFQSSGIDKAIDRYHDIRGDLNKDFTLRHRKQLHTLATQVGEDAFAFQIPQHAVEDLGSDEAKDWLSDVIEDSPIIAEHNGQNTSDHGLQYVDIAIVNFGEKIDTVVSGPAEHPFGYGVPIRAGMVRLERWPVGTRLTQEIDNTRRTKLVLEVSAEDRGRVIRLSGKSK